MALAHAILATLLNERITGYDLAKRFSGDGFFWHATHQQIYRELARLEEQGAIETTARKPGPRNERERTITDLGRDLLSMWVQTRSEPASIKEDILVKCLAAALVEPKALAAQIAEHRNGHEKRLNRHKTMLRDMFRDSRPDRISDVGSYLALKAGIAYESAWIEWARQATMMLNDGKYSSDTG